MDLFDLRDFTVTISPKALMVPEFKALWDRDKSNNKSTALSELAYVYYLSDFKSPYLLSLDISIVAYTVAKASSILAAVVAAPAFNVACVKSAQAEALRPFWSN